MSKQSPPQFYSVKEAADALGVSEKTVRRLIKKDELKVHRVGRQLRISADDFRAYIACRRGYALGT